MPYGLTGVLDDPVLQLFSGQTLLNENDDWDPALAADFTKTGAFPWPAGSKDAAIALWLAPGAYTVHVAGKAETGVSLVEVFEDQ